MAKLRDYDYGKEWDKDDRDSLTAQGFNKEQINKYRDKFVKTRHMTGGQQQAAGRTKDTQGGKQGLSDYSAYGVAGKGKGVAKQEKAGIKEGWTMQDVKHLQHSGYTDKQIRNEMLGRSDSVRMGKNAKAFMNSTETNKKEWAETKTPGQGLGKYDHGDSWTTQDENAMKDRGFTKEQMERYRENHVATKDLGAQARYETGRGLGKKVKNISDYSAYGVSGKGVGVGAKKKAGTKEGWTQIDIKHLHDQGFSNEEIRAEMQAREGNMRMGAKAKAYLAGDWEPNRETTPTGDDQLPEDGATNPPPDDTTTPDPGDTTTPPPGDTTTPPPADTTTPPPADTTTPPPGNTTTPDPGTTPDPEEENPAIPYEKPDPAPEPDPIPEAPVGDAPIDYTEPDPIPDAPVGEDPIDYKEPDPVPEVDEVPDTSAGVTPEKEEYKDTAPTYTPSSYAVEWLNKNRNKFGMKQYEGAHDMPGDPYESSTLQQQHENERKNNNTSDRAWEEPELYDYKNPELTSNQGNTNKYINASEERWQDSLVKDEDGNIVGTQGSTRAAQASADAEAITKSRERIAGLDQRVLDMQKLWAAKAAKIGYNSFGRGGNDTTSSVNKLTSSINSTNPWAYDDDDD